MFKFENGVLHICKEEVPDLHLNILDDTYQAYQRYINETVYEDIETLADDLREKFGMDDLGIVAHVGDLVQLTFGKTQTKDSNNYYPVTCHFTRGGNPITGDIELLHIPFMDTSGKINVNGERKVLLSVQRAAEDISYSMKGNLLNIAMPHANVRIIAHAKSIKMKYGRREYPMDRIIPAMMYLAGDDTRLSDIFTNTVLINSMSMDDSLQYEFAYTYLEQSTASNLNKGLISKLTSKQYRLGLTRQALNETLTLKRAVGCTLSRDVLNYHAGTLVTEQMVDEFIRNRINIIHVRNYDYPEGYHLADNLAPITFIPAGLHNGEFLHALLPQYASYQYIPEDVNLGDNFIFIDNKRTLTKEIIQFLVDYGYRNLIVCAERSVKRLKFSFEREIVGNYTAKLGILTGGKVPAGRSADEYVYYYNNPNLDPTPNEYMNAHDYIALVSVIGEILSTGRSFLLDRDTSFLKKVLQIDELFSETLCKTMSAYVTKYANPISKFLEKGVGSNPFKQMHYKWYSMMVAEKFLAPADTINISAEVSQVCHVNTIMPSTAEVVDEQRHLAMPFYGRICPYETPAGKKLGLVNTRALGARNKNGLLYVPYRKVLGNSNGITISNNIEWLSVKDELGHKFGDILSLKKDAAGNYMNTPVLARVPNPDVSDEPFIFKDIMAYELAGGYVTVLPEQFLSPTAALIPFACCDDPVRISYGLSQLRQAVYLQNSQKPRVATPMWNTLVNALDTISVVAPCNGRVVSIDQFIAEIKDSLGTIHKVYIDNKLNGGKLDTTVELLVNAGDKVREGVPIANIRQYPQPFVVRAPYDGRVIAITDNSITISKTMTASNFVDLESTDKINIENGRIMGQSAVFANIHVSVGDIVHKGQILADTCASRDGIYSPSRNPLVAYACTGYNYEDGISCTETASVNYTSIIAHKVNKRMSTRTYTHMRAQLPEGFKYCNEGDSIGSIKMRKSIGDTNTIERDIRTNMKATGIPFEVTVNATDSKSKTFTFNLLGFKKLQSGDKMSGCHGNKGVVSKVRPDSEGLQLKNGLVVEFELNPLGVPSRMNLGQVNHAHMGLCAEVLQQYIDSPSFNGASPEEVAYLMRYTYKLANTPAIGDNITHQYNRAAFDAVCSAFPLIPKEFNDSVWDNIENVIDWRGVFEEDGSAYVYDPVTDEYLEDKVTIGYPVFNKLMQEADEKLNVRAGLLEEEYARTNSQPQKSDSSAKGQRMAEMELMALAAMGLSNFIDEVLNEKSDNVGRRTNIHLEQLGYPERVQAYSCYSRAVENLMYFFEGCGVKLDVPTDVVDVSSQASLMKYELNVPKLIHEKTQTHTAGHRKVYDTPEDLSDVED